ncbi:MAG TPA: DUF5908 family protein [Microthrixaceae bacterium]|nr:DUF5908 family protein [Microthrixaceae bacterium]
MPIEIRELHIKVAVNAPAGNKPAGAPGPAPGAEGDARQALIADCVEQVMELLRDQKER